MSDYRGVQLFGVGLWRFHCSNYLQMLLLPILVDNILYDQVFSERQKKEEELHLTEQLMSEERQVTERVVEQLEESDQDKYREIRREIEAVQHSIDQQEEQLLKARRLAQNYEEEVIVIIHRKYYYTMYDMTPYIILDSE